VFIKIKLNSVTYVFINLIFICSLFNCVFIVLTVNRLPPGRLKICGSLLRRTYRFVSSLTRPDWLKFHSLLFNGHRRNISLELQQPTRERWPLPPSSAKIKKKRSRTLIMVHVFIEFFPCKSIKYVASNDPTGKNRSC
jgi:hypothetical protein